MLYSRNYSRLFITMKQESSRFCIENRPVAGRCIIEIRNNEGKLMLFAQGLKPRVLYRMFLIKCDDEGTVGINGGLIGIDDRGKGEANIAFDPDDVLNSGVKIEAFEAVVIAAEGIGELEAPLAGYRADYFDWKKNFRRFDEKITQTQDKENEKPLEKELLSKDKKEEKPENAMEKTFSVKDSEEETLFNEDGKSISDGADDLNKAENSIREIGQNTLEYSEQNTQKKKYEEIKGQGGETKAADFNVFIENFKKSMRELEKYAKMTEAERPIRRSRGIQGSEYIKKYNRRIKPFENESSDIMWYRIMPCELTMVNAKLWRHLNNPFINSCFKKYRHLILGIKNKDGRESFIIGVPEKYDESFVKEAAEQGFDSFMCRDNSEPVQGAMGYWLMETD